MSIQLSDIFNEARTADEYRKEKARREKEEAKAERERDKNRYNGSFLTTNPHSGGFIDKNHRTTGNQDPNTYKNGINLNGNEYKKADKSEKDEVRRIAAANYAYNYLAKKDGLEYKNIGKDHNNEDTEIERPKKEHRDEFNKIKDSANRHIRRHPEDASHAHNTGHDEYYKDPNDPKYSIGRTHHYYESSIFESVEFI